MNNRMYLNPANQENLRLLDKRGVSVIAPGEGELASHAEHGIGRLAEPSTLLEVCESLLTPRTLAGVRVLVSAGGTREPIDSVRYIGNRSSGRMGFALAAAAARRGAEVTLVAANVTIEPPGGVRLVEVGSAAELSRACAEAFDAADVLLMAAAVADFRPASVADTKLKKDRGAPTIELEPTEDVLETLAQRRRPGQVIVGFAAEHGPRAVDYAREKLERKGLDVIVVNDISLAGIGFDAPDNEVTILTGHGAQRHVPHARKVQVAQAVLDEVEQIRIAGKETGGTGRADTRSAARA
jgi:phosphopantothenoylcysteine decarboxylase/phosphopantothenate--cysteine ligase